MQSIQEFDLLATHYPEVARIAARYQEPGPQLTASHAPCPTAKGEFMVDVAHAILDVDAMSAKAFHKYSIHLLVDFLHRSHRYYLEVYLPRLGRNMEQLSTAYPDEPAITKVLIPLYRQFKDDLLAHILWEEKGLFPYALSLEGHATVAELDFEVHTFLDQHPDHHTELDHMCHLLAQVDQKYTGDMAFKMLRNRMLQLKADLNLHGVIEDEVLIAKIRELQRQ